jgi:hypothetical protein
MPLDYAIASPDSPPGGSVGSSLDAPDSPFEWPFESPFDLPWPRSSDALLG